jgi:DNA-directed RNA polymerase specialized sigma24 family protein
VNGNFPSHWCEALYDAKAAQLILYGRALGLSHGEAEDILQETFLALMQLDFAPVKPEHYCVRSFRNRALNYRRSLWRRLTRDWEVFADGHHWFGNRRTKPNKSYKKKRCACWLNSRSNSARPSY